MWAMCYGSCDYCSGIWSQALVTPYFTTEDDMLPSVCCHSWTTAFEGTTNLVVEFVPIIVRDMLARLDDVKTQLLVMELCTRSALLFAALVWLVITLIQKSLPATEEPVHVQVNAATM